MLTDYFTKPLLNCSQFEYLQDFIMGWRPMSGLRVFLMNWIWHWSQSYCIYVELSVIMIYKKSAYFVRHSSGISKHVVDGIVVFYCGDHIDDVSIQYHHHWWNKVDEVMSMI